MTREKVIQWLKTGDFTIAYHDHEQCSIHKGKKEEYEQTTSKPIYECDWIYDGYIPEIVALLTEALRGKVVTI